MRLLAAVALTASLAAISLAKDEPKDAQDALQGEWKIVEFVKGGKATDAAKLGAVTIKGDQLTIRDGKRDEPATFTLDPKAKPPAIDIRPGNAGAKKDAVIKGIYKLEKDRLTIAFGGDGTERPKEFKSEAGSKTGLFVLERVKK